MATSDPHDNTPDSWDQGLNGQINDMDVDKINQNFSALNVNASEFVPGKGTNVFAAEFVPSHTPEPPPDLSFTDGISPMHEPHPPNIEDALGDPKISDEDKMGENSPDDDDDIDEDEDDDDDDDEALETDSSEASTKPAKKPAVKVLNKVKKHHVNVVFIGHVDAGKSTIGGHLMYLTGMVEKRTLEKYEREAKLKSRETWYLSWALDTNQEERDKGKTVEVGRAFFETEKKHFTILDAPGHKSFVPNMISGASQADVAVLVISARRGEFEAGLDRGGQTREHAMLAKTAGVKHLVVLINKMDDPTVLWDEERYNECKEGLIPCLRKCGYNPRTDFHFMPVSGLTGAFLRDPPDISVCPWYRGPCLIDYMDTLPILERMADGPIRLPIIDRYRDMGTIVLGKVESGTVVRNQVLLLMPNRTPVEVMQLWSDDDETEKVGPGENVKVKLKGVEEEDVSPGFVLCSPDNVCSTSRIFDAQIVILEHKSIICAGYSPVLHIHACAEEITIKGLMCLMDKKTGEKTQMRPRFIKQDQAGIARFEVNGGHICLETFKNFPQMGRFTLRDEGKTIAIGKVLKLRDSIQN